VPPSLSPPRGSETTVAIHIIVILPARRRRSHEVACRRIWGVGNHDRIATHLACNFGCKCVASVCRTVLYDCTKAPFYDLKLLAQSHAPIQSRLPRGVAPFRFNEVATRTEVGLSCHWSVETPSGSWGEWNRQ